MSDIEQGQSDLQAALRARDAIIGELYTTLKPLCPCNPDPEAPEEPGCPLHGDGTTFAEEVKAMRAERRKLIDVLEEVLRVSALMLDSLGGSFTVTEKDLVAVKGAIHQIPGDDGCTWNLTLIGEDVDGES